MRFAGVDLVRAVQMASGGPLIARSKSRATARQVSWRRVRVAECTPPPGATMMSAPRSIRIRDSSGTKSSLQMSSPMRPNGASTVMSSSPGST